MASATNPELPQAGLPTRNKHGKRIFSPSQTKYGIGPSGATAQEPGHNIGPTEYSPERPTGRWSSDDKENSGSRVVSKSEIDKIYQGIDRIKMHAGQLETELTQIVSPETSPVLTQVGPARNSPEDTSAQHTVGYVPNEPSTIAQLQKDAALAHSSRINELLHKYLPSPLLKPYPIPSDDKPHPSGPIPSILDLEVRHAIASAPIQVYLNHIPSKVAREEFLRHLTKSEEEHFGHGSQVATVMHQESLEAETNENKRSDMHTKWNDKGTRRKERKEKLRDEMIEELGPGKEGPEHRTGV